MGIRTETEHASADVAPELFDRTAVDADGGRDR